MVEHPGQQRIFSTVSGEWAFIGSEAATAGFVAVGVAPAGALPDAAAATLDRWIAAGYAADMGFMQRTLPQRLNLRHPGILPDADAVVVAALPYGDGALSEGVWRSVARHARGKDYHDTVKKALHRLAEAVRRRFPGSVCRIFCDSAPTAERTWAVAAGIGALGKSGALLVPGYGPKVVLGEVVCAHVPVPTVLAPPPHSPFSGCATCTACMDACPTGALSAPGVVDSRRCLSYWTIERKDRVLPEFVSNRSRSIFGCDMCTAVCPAAVGTVCGLEGDAVGRRTDGLELDGFIALSDDALSARFEGTALVRAGWKNLRENARLLLDQQTRKRRGNG